MQRRVALALAAHPDDIEMMMGGTLLRLGQAGYELHYLNLSTGSCGTVRESHDAIAARRTAEARAAAAVLGATHHAPLVDDLEIYYEPALLRRVSAIVREVNPGILLLQSPQDYMEDHMNSARLGASAAFCRGLKNYITDPPRSPRMDDVTVYHALPWGLRDPLRKPVEAELFVDVAPVMEAKRAALACHRSQKEWLDVSQGLDSYLDTMADMTRRVGAMSGTFAYAEGWRRRLHLGYCAEDADPLSQSLGDAVVRNERY